jgi:hypothetical protein
MKIGIQNNEFVSMVPKMANRHGLITGATGTGKTVTLKVLAEQFSELGVPVFLQDVKGDLTGFIEEGSESKRFRERLDLIGLESAAFTTYPTTFWDIFGKEGHPVRTTVSDMGPLMISKLLDLNDVQTSVLYTLFNYVDEEGLLLLDFKDLMATINFVSLHKKELPDEYRTISSASIGAIKRKLMILEQEGIENFFGEPALDIKDLMVVDNLGRGMINVLASSQLSMSPSLYSTFLLWLLSELFEELDEVGDVEKPRLVFFFDEAHLIFDDMSEYLLEKFEQVVKLIRSKGVGVYFITQTPLDIPDSVLGQLGNRVQHALRAYTPRDKKAVDTAADTFRQNPDFDTADVITNLGVGEALLSFLDEKGIPGIVERAYIMPPKSKIGPASDPEALKRYIGMSYIGTKYNQSVDRPSAYEMLTQKAEHLAAKKEETEKQTKQKSVKRTPEPEKESMLGNIFKSATKKGRRSDSTMEKFLKSTASSIGTQAGRALVRGILGSLTK